MKIIYVKYSACEQYKVTVRFEKVLDEYRVRLALFDDRKWIELTNSEYFTDDRVDATNTANLMLDRLVTTCNEVDNINQ
jgi:hypothetical protein